MNSGILFSIIVASYNNGKYLPECLDSLINQTYKNIEIIVVDDASEDNSVEIIKEYQKKYNRIKLIENKRNKGVGCTKSLGVRSSNGKIIGTIGADDALVQNAIEIMVNEHFRNPKASLIYSQLYNCDENLNIIEIASTTGEILKNESYLTLGNNKNNHITSFRTFKKSFYDKTAGYSKYFKKAVDKDIIYKLEEVGETIFINKPLYYYRHHNGSISLNKNIWQARIWEFRAKKVAFKRRLKNNFEPNIIKEMFKTEAQFVYKQSAIFELQQKRYFYYLRSILSLFHYISIKELGRFIYYSIKKTFTPDKF